MAKPATCVPNGTFNLDLSVFAIKTASQILNYFESKRILLIRGFCLQVDDFKRFASPEFLQAVGDIESVVYFVALKNI